MGFLSPSKPKEPPKPPQIDDAVVARNKRDSGYSPGSAATTFTSPQGLLGSLGSVAMGALTR